MFYAKSLSCLALCSIAATTLQAVTIAEWGEASDIVSSDPGLSGDFSTVLSLSTLRNPTVGPSYYPNATGKTPQFYSAGTRGMTIQNDNPDAIDARGNGILEAQMIVVWTKDYFINGGDTATSLELNSLSRTTGNSGSAVTTVNRFVIRLDTDFYISEVTGNVSDPSSVTWYNYNPTVDFTAIDESVPNIANLANFNDLSAAGIFVGSTRGSSGTIQQRLFAFSADATIIPEPSDYAMFLGSGLLVGALLMRRRRS